MQLQCILYLLFSKISNQLQYTINAINLGIKHLRISLTFRYSISLMRELGF